MKKFFTYLFASAAFCMMGTVNAVAQEEDETDLTPDMFMNYADPANPQEVENLDYNVGSEIGGGAVVIGTGSLWANVYADLSDYDYMKAETNAGFFRIFMNRIGDNGQCSDAFDANTEAIDGNKAWVQERYYTISDDQTLYTINLKKIIEDFGYAHLNGVKFPWNDGGNICESIVVGKGTPTGVKEVSLMEVIKAQQYNLAGQKVSDNAKGLVIKNGKKYVK